MSDIRDDVRALRNEYGGDWGEHPKWTDEDWRTEVQNGDTRHGYWEWVANRIDAEG